MTITNNAPVFLGFVKVCRSDLMIIHVSAARISIPKNKEWVSGKRMRSMASSIADIVNRKIRIQYLIDCPVRY